MIKIFCDVCGKQIQKRCKGKWDCCGSSICKKAIKRLQGKQTYKLAKYHKYISEQ